MNGTILLLATITAFVTGIAVHEATHWVVGGVMGTFEAFGVGFSKHKLLKYIPTALVVVQSRENYWSRFAPLIWLLPLIAVQPVYYQIPTMPRLFILVFSMVAGGSVLVSDLPPLLFDMDMDEKHNWVWLVDYR